uniref:RRM domain-containing protein n=1 Tax=Meloidogyne incognita TaxID=6306 RepID=A0A914NT38_MELIC
MYLCFRGQSCFIGNFNFMGLLLSNDQATNDKTENNGYDSKTINEQNEIVVEDSDEPNDDGTEQKKIFCGGISYDTTGDDLASHFSQFGSIKEAQVKYDRM